ncbi:hypothetical protein BDF22DRAFT_743632 [Syncephalis plumigaleata]|nr:hypothetical protein BDF22DRAFT_743632 [Syncephalis plumigaleata]
MGVTACGKTTLAKQLALHEADKHEMQLSVDNNNANDATSIHSTTTSHVIDLLLFYIEADDHHSKQNLIKMSSGLALTDEDRWPWLNALCMAVNERGDYLARQLVSNNGQSIHLYLACSCLKRIYRDVFRKQLAYPVRFIYLNVSQQCAEQRAATRIAHFMPSSLVASQFAVLESPTDDEHTSNSSDVITLDGEMTASTLLTMAIDTLNVS